MNFKTSRKLSIKFRGIFGIYPILIKKNQHITTYNQLDMRTLGSSLIVPKILLGHLFVGPKCRSITYLFNRSQIVATKKGLHRALTFIHYYLESSGWVAYMKNGPKIPSIMLTIHPTMVIIFFYHAVQSLFNTSFFQCPFLELHQPTYNTTQI